GDIIAYGTEPTLESPLCDQMSLKIASDWRGRSFCCVSGLGADGEIMLGEAYQRMAGIASENGFYGMLELNQNDLDRYRKILDGVPTECSKQLIRYIDACNGQEPLKSSRFSKLLDSLNSFANQPPISYSFAFPDHDHLFPEHEVQRYGIRNGTRTVELSLLTLGTLIFDPRAVWKSNLFAQESLITSNDNFLEVERKVRSRGICTELTHPE
ncbi:MAG: DUF1152 domain-containing protein, partial [Bdellovibrionales bacterium]|nr:DUF1152 domain-containing protein [Bdellovibrionales bacterium]